MMQRYQISSQKTKWCGQNRWYRQTDKQTDRQPTKTGEYPSPQGPGQQVKISGMGDSINLGFWIFLQI